MQISLTNAGIALLNQATAPVVVTAYRLGDAFNYTPSLTDTGLHGNVVFTGVPPAPLVITADLIKYGVVLDYDLPNAIDFGEIGYFVGTTLFALGANAVLLHKIPQVTGTDGNAIRIDAYLNMVGTAYNMWGDAAESNNQFQLPTLSSVDRLPQAKDASPNSYIIDGADSTQSAFLAYTNRHGLWNFDAYMLANTQQVTITGATPTSISIAASAFNQDMNPKYFGMTFAQFSSGQNYSLCRYVQSVGFSGQTVTFNFNSPMAIVPVVGDTVIFFSRQALSVNTVILPIATPTVLGAVKIGTGINAAVDGTISIDPTTFPVTSVNGKAGGAVVIAAADIPNLARVALSNSYNDLDDKPSGFLLQVATATTLGGVKANTSNRGLVISSTGVIDLNFDPVRTVNGVQPDSVTGNLILNIPPTPIGLVTPTQIPNAADMNTYLTAGLFFVLDADAPSLANAPGTSAGRLGAIVEIEPFSTAATGGDVIQRWQGAGVLFFRRYSVATNTFGPWTAVLSNSNLPLATPTSVGVVSVGTTLTVTPAGLLNTAITSVNGQTSGNIVIDASSTGAIPEVPASPPGDVWARASGQWIDLANYVFEAGTF